MWLIKLKLELTNWIFLVVLRQCVPFLTIKATELNSNWFLICNWFFRRKYSNDRWIIWRNGWSLDIKETEVDWFGAHRVLYRDRQRGKSQFSCYSVKIHKPYPSRPFSPQSIS